MIIVRSKTTNEIVHLKKDSTLFNEWLSTADSLSDQLLVVLNLIIGHTALLVISTTAFICVTIRDGCFLRSLSILESYIGVNRPSFANESIVDEQCNKRKVDIIGFPLLWIFHCTMAILYVIERKWLSTTAFTVFCRYGTPAAYGFLLLNAVVTFFVAKCSGFYPWITIVLLCFFGFRLIVSYRYSECANAYFNFIASQCPVNERRNIHKTSKKKQDFFLRNAIREEIIDYTTFPNSDALELTSPLNVIVVVVKGSIILDYEQKHLELSEEIIGELKRYQELCYKYDDVSSEENATFDSCSTILLI